MRSDSSRQEYAVLDRGCACLQCKRRKKRCDGNHPVCGPCQRFGTAGECQFPSPPKPSPPRTKAHAMRLQIHELENQLATLQNIVQMNNVASYTGSGPSQPIPSSSLGYMTPQDRDPEWAPRYHETDAGGHALGLLSFPPAGFQSRDMHTPDTPPDPSVRERLLVNFLANRHRCLFECDEAHFMDRFHAPSGSPNSMHPGLISAALLLGNYFPPSTSSNDQFSSHSFTPKGARDPATEVYLLQETKHHLTHNLASSDRLVDFMRGTALLTWYYFAKGSVQEARWYAAGLASLAAACHLSFQTSPISPNPNEPSSFSPSGHRNIPQQPIAIIPPAASVIEMEDRISLFWTIFCLDRFASISGGTSPLIPDKDIWTSWPRDPSEWKSARTDIPSSMPTLVPETLLPVLDYTSGSGDVSRLIPQNPLSFRAIAAFLLERIHRVSKASSPGADQLSLLQRRYNDPNLRQSWDSIKAAAQKIEHCLPFIPSPFAASQAQLIGGEPNAHSLGTGGHSVVKERSASPPAFHAPLMAEPCRGTPYPSTSSFPQTPLSSVPHSPNVTGQGFAHQSTPHLPQTSILGDPSHAAGLLLAHSALCATRIGIHLGARYAVSDTAPPINDGPGNNADYYRPSHPQSQPSLQTPTSSRPQAMYHGPQLIRPSSTNSTVFFQQPSTTASPVVTASDVASWPIWNAPFTSGFPPNAPQYPHSPLTLPPHSFTPQPQSLERPLTSQAEHTADLPILLAAGKIAELASLAMQSHGVFEELDMMIRWCWIPALDVLRGEIQRQEQELSSPYSFSQTSYQYPPGGQHPMNKPATPTHPLDYSSSLPRLRAQRDHLQRALDRLNVMFQQGGTCSSLSSSSSASPAITPSSERGSNAVLCGFDLADASGVGLGSDKMRFWLEADIGHSSPFISGDTLPRFPRMSLSLKKICSPELLMPDQPAIQHSEASSQHYIDTLASSPFQHPLSH